jgi:hypothetical protein
MIAKRRCRNLSYIVHVKPVGLFRKWNFSCNCWMCSEGDELQRLKLKKRCSWMIEDAAD